MSKSIDLDKLEATIDKTKKLLRDRQPGLMSWNKFLYDNLKELKEYLKDLE